MHEQRELALNGVRGALANYRPDIVVAGPAFDAGRYGTACGAVCATALEMDIPAVTAMHPENPGVLLHRRQLHIVPTGASAGDMGRVLPVVARLAHKLALREELGPAEVEGYLPRGVRRYMDRDRPAYRRAIEMLHARVTGAPWTSEVGAQLYEVVPPADPVVGLGTVKLGLVTSGGLVPRGNPDHLPGGNAQHFFRYDIGGYENLNVADWEVVHTGFSTVVLNTRNPAYVLPLPALRHLERAGTIGSIHGTYYSTVGNGTSVSNAKRMGQEIAQELKEAGVRAALLVAT
jgi:glycine reductase